MTDKVTVGIDGDRRVFEYLEKLNRVAGDNSPIWRKLGNILLAGTLERFSRGVNPDGQAWKTSWRAVMQSGQTLQDTGRLRSSIQMLVAGKVVSVGTNVKYGKTHQFGATIRAKNGGYLTFRGAGGWARVRSVTIPKRPFLGLSTKDESDIIAKIEEFLLDVNP